MIVNAQLVSELAKQGRTNRYPRHNFSIKHRPWVLQPFFIAPVIPGETMKNMLFQSSAYSDPINDRLLGWHLEHYFFYVKHRDLNIPNGTVDEHEFGQELQNMMLDPSWAMPADWKTSTSPAYYHTVANDTVNWVHLCTAQIAQDFFREEGETWYGYLIDGDIAVACWSGNNRSWIDSLTDDANMPAGGDIGAATTVEAAEGLRTVYEQLMTQQLVNMTYEDFLRTYGVPTSKIEDHKPELLRQLKNWTTPVAAIDPADGSAVAAVKWEVTERADKARYFPEPGWLIGSTVARPKVYMKNLRTSAANVMDNALSWLPAVMRDDAWTSLKALADGYGPVPAANSGAGGYWLDVRDILLYGDQFHNYGTTFTSRNFVDLPATNLVNKYYPSLTDAKNMFVDTTNGGFVFQDGLVSLTIAGTQKDYT